MGFGKMIELLKIKEKGKIVICSTGAFYLAVGKDAVLLHKILGLKLTCLAKEVCKVGVPIASLEKYTKLIEEKGYGYIVYKFEKTNWELKLIKEKEGKINNEKEEKANCYICKNTIKMYKKPDKYIEAVAKLYEKEKINVIKENEEDENKNGNRKSN